MLTIVFFTPPTPNLVNHSTDFPNLPASSLLPVRPAVTPAAIPAATLSFGDFANLLPTPPSCLLPRRDWCADPPCQT